MTILKGALVLGVTIIGLLGAMHYLNPQEAIITPKLRSHSLHGIQDLEHRFALFKVWMQEHKKIYSLGETHLRFALWNKAYDYVQNHNAKNLSWTAGLNQFSDLTNEEFSSMYLGFKWDPVNQPPENVQFLDESDIANDIDWREKGAVTPIKNQGQCGSCYTFSSAGALEAVYFLKKGTLVELSKQQMVDCSKSYGNQGCNGGLMDNCFKYVKAQGIVKETDYAYKGAVGTCRYNASKVVFKNTGFTDVPKNSPTQLQAALNKQPVSVAVEANNDAFKNYKSGVLSSGCGTNLDHAILAVGYASNYWIVKNSWGTAWGEQGYIRIQTGTQNSGAGVCGINSVDSYPTA